MNDDFAAALETVHDNITIEDDNRTVRLIGPGGTELVNAHGPAQSDITKWIDRRSNWGNPFKLESDGGDYSREESVDLYRGWFYGHLETDEWTPEDFHEIIIMNYLPETYNSLQTPLLSLVLVGYLQQSLDYLRLCLRPRA
jgi:hypothetical protein